MQVEAGSSLEKFCGSGTCSRRVRFPKASSNLPNFYTGRFENSIVTQRKGIVVIFVVQNAARKRKWSNRAVGFYLISRDFPELR